MQDTRLKNRKTAGGFINLFVKNSAGLDQLFRKSVSLFRLDSRLVCPRRNVGTQVSWLNRLRPGGAVPASQRCCSTQDLELLRSVNSATTQN